MKFTFRRYLTILAALCAVLPASQAFPPAPDGIIYGQVKDRYGNPLSDPSDYVLLTTPSGGYVWAAIQPKLALGVNYALHVPMDSGVTATRYATNALVAKSPFLLAVVVNGITNLPIEMIASTPSMCNPGKMMVQNLTLGTDANGDGIPDEWEQVFLSQLGLNVALANLNPNSDYAHDGLTLRQEYLLGNYPNNPGGNFKIRLVSCNAGSAAIAFTTVSQRTYTAFGSSDLQNWTPLSFTVPAEGATVMNARYATTVQSLQIQTVKPSSGPTVQFFRLESQ